MSLRQRRQARIDPWLIQGAVGGPFNVPRKAYMWVLRNPNASAVVSDMTNLDLVKENLPLAGRKGT